MAFRSFLHLGNNGCRCLFTKVQFKSKFYTMERYKQIRHLNKLRRETKPSKTHLQNYFFKRSAEHTPSLWKPFIFTIMFSGTTFIAVAIWEYENLRQLTYKMIRHYKQGAIYRTGWRRKMENWWKNLTPGEKMFVPICFLNVLVFLSWHIPAFRPTMQRYFCSNTVSGGCWPMLFLTFSHYSFLHLIVNMYVLYNISTVAVNSLGREQFLGLYLSSGVVSSFTSYLYRVAFGIKNSSLGASGALMGILGYVCTQFPNMYLCIVFLPMLKFKASTAIKAMLGLDGLGCVLRWQRLDHAAHLGGALFGIFWQAWGSANIWQKREPALMYWHQIRGPPRSN